ncbi:E3 ubiquitin ligase family protein [Actinopolymorpha alba]|uniref:E3 ubiquitin ligase family protein n=1 Tax=Actinopolymorpha alba TaxID=533267 RepID=UPI00036F3F15|nr:E3 ubiquitin ligase family protein [Actinopolymorpha alba]
MIVAGVVALVVAAVCGYFAWRARARQHAMITTETLSAQELGALHQAAAQAAGPGAFLHKVEVTGQVQPGQSGLLKSELASVDSVWHRHVVTRKYWETRRDSKGNTRRVNRSERVAERTSDLPFVVQDATGVVPVYPGAVQADGAQKVLDRFDRDSDGGRTNIQLGGFRLSLPRSGRSGTYGYQYKEWVLRPGQRVFVLGEASDGNGELAITEPSIISTRSEAELIQSARSQQTLFTIATVAGAIAGPVLLVLGLFS